MLPYFQSLGDCIERQWLSCSYDEEAFPPLVLAELERNPPAVHVAAEEIVDWVFNPSHAISQPSARKLFGEPPVLLFQAPRFYIEALFWLSGTTDIHQHAFSGAFSVLAGSSVHSDWRFTPEKMINSRMLRGRLERVSTEILRPGCTRAIHSGNKLIHQLFHLEVPSVTIVVRTHADRHHLPQYSYHSPGLAISEEESDGLRTRRLLFLEGMVRGQIGGLQEQARKLIESGDLETVYDTFSLLRRRKADKDILQELQEVGRRRHGDIMDLFLQVFEQERRTNIAIALRSKTSDPDARFLLALLMLMPDRNAIFETIRLQFPGVDPMAVVEAGLERLSGKENIGFELNSLNRVIFAGLVEGLGMDGLILRLRDKFSGKSVDDSLDKIQGLTKKMVESELFRPLFSESPLAGAHAA